MAYIGKNPTAVPLTSSDITDGIITTAKLAAGVGGKVLQVIQGTELGSETSISSSSFTDAGISASITPSSTSSKILISVTFHVSARDSDGNLCYVETQLLRNSSSIYKAGRGQGYDQYYDIGGASSVDIWSMAYFDYLDSPSTTSATTYKIQGRNLSGDYFRVNAGHINLKEIAG